MSVDEVGTDVSELTRAQRGVVMSRLVLGHGGQWTISQLIRLDGDLDEADGALPRPAEAAAGETSEPDGGWPRIGDAELDLYLAYLAGVGLLPAAGRQRSSVSPAATSAGRAGRRGR